MVVHQQLTQINLTSGLMSIEANRTQRFTRHDDTASGCVPGVDLGLHQIGVANGRKVPGTCIHVHVREYYSQWMCAHMYHAHVLLYN